MILHKREQWVPLAKTELEIALNEFEEDKDLVDAVMLYRVGLLISKIAAAMRKNSEFIADPVRGTALDHLVYNYARKNTLTDIEILQALTSFVDGKLKYMLRYERHGNYDKPAGLE